MIAANALRPSLHRETYETPRANAGVPIQRHPLHARRIGREKDVSEEPQQYWAEIMPLAGEVPVEKIVGKILHDLPDLQNRANLAAWFAFNVKAGLRSAEALEAHGSDKLAWCDRR